MARPLSKAQIQLLREFWEDGFSSRRAASAMCIGKVAAYRYFKKWREEKRRVKLAQLRRQFSSVDNRSTKPLLDSRNI